MLKINDTFKTEHDGRQWVLYESYMGKAGKKDGKETPPKMQQRESYHGTLRQACKKVVDSSVTDCSDAESIMSVMDKAGWILEGQLSGYLGEEK